MPLTRPEVVTENQIIFAVLILTTLRDEFQNNSWESLPKLLNAKDPMKVITERDWSLLSNVIPGIPRGLDQYIPLEIEKAYSLRIRPKHYQFPLEIDTPQVSPRAIRQAEVIPRFLATSLLESSTLLASINPTQRAKLFREFVGAPYSATYVATPDARLSKQTQIALSNGWFEMRARHAESVLGLATDPTTGEIILHSNQIPGQEYGRFSIDDVSNLQRHPAACCPLCYVFLTAVGRSVPRIHFNTCSNWGYQLPSPLLPDPVALDAIRNWLLRMGPVILSVSQLLVNRAKEQNKLIETKSPNSQERERGLHREERKNMILLSLHRFLANPTDKTAMNIFINISEISKKEDNCAEVFDILGSIAFL